jgi:hypothetical protein
MAGTAISPKQRAANVHPNCSYHPGAAAADATEDWSVFRCPFDGIIRRVSWIPNADVTGAATNHFTLSVVNKGTDGNGTTAMGTAKTYDNGVNTTDFTEAVLVDSGDGIAVNKGQVIALRRTKVGTGLAMPEGAVVVHYEPDAHYE